VPSVSSDPVADWAGASVAVELWRDHDPLVRQLVGMALGDALLTGDLGAAARDLYAGGARCVRIAEPVDVCRDAPAASARALVLIRELTGRGMAVEWTARCADGCVADRRLAHLYPPGAVLGAPSTVAIDWRATYFPCRCVFRRGPGFVEVRDRRFGTLEMFTIDDPLHMAAIDAMAEGLPSGSAPGEVLADFVGAELVAEQAGHLWWLPVRVHRWPTPALMV
jgi:hypothetical protein